MTDQIRNQHHLLARLAADAAKSDEELSALTGYSPAYIAGLRRQRGFKELVAHYTLRLGSGDHGPVSSTAPGNVGERLRSLGFSALDELQARLAEDPQSWSKRELMELTDLTLIKTQQQRSRDIPPPGESVSIQIRFVRAEPVTEPGVEIHGEVIEHDPIPPRTLTRRLN